MSVVTKAFKSGNSVAVRLPAEFGITEGTELELDRAGDALLIRRRKQMTGAELAAALRALPKPKSAQKRDKIIFPKRPGL